MADTRKRHAVTRPPVLLGVAPGERDDHPAKDDDQQHEHEQQQRRVIGQRHLCRVRREIESKYRIGKESNIRVGQGSEGEA
jgi:hypothetical protein